MLGRYELVGINYNNQGTIIPTKNGKKLTLKEADLFTSLFENKDELYYYLNQKGLINFVPQKFVLIYKCYRQTKYIECIYKDNKELVNMINPTNTNKINSNNYYFKYMVTFLTKYMDNELIEYAYEKKYINQYIYEKLIEYKKTRKEFILNKIKQELSKEYLQVRKLYTIIQLYKTNNFEKKVTGTSVDPYIEYLIQKANNNDENAYEELKQMDLEKTHKLKM